MRRLLVLVVLAGAAVAVPARPATAHAVLRGSDPPDRVVMREAPDRVVLRFSEAVAVSRNSVRVLDHHGDVVVRRGARHVQGDSAQVELRLPDLDEGTYVVAWRVVSADSHPAVGAVSFRVGEATDDFHIGASILEPPEGNRAVGVAFGVARFAVFSSVILLVGGVGFLAFVWPQGRRLRRPCRLVAAALVVTTVGTILAVALQGAYAAGGELADAVSPGVVAEALDSRYGHATVARLALLAVIAAVLLLARRRAPDRAGATASRLAGPVVVAAGLALLLTVSWVGHASTGRLVPLAMVLDVVHLAAVSMWLGGLVVLAAFVLRRHGDQEGEGDVEPEERAQAVARFSDVAFVAVMAVVATGTFQSWRQLDGLTELISTTYGRLLLAKLALVAGILAAARMSRRLVTDPLRVSRPALSVGPGAAATAAADPLPRLRRWVGLELAVAVAVIAVTTALVNAVPARQASKAQGPGLPFSAELVKQGVKVSVTVEPARTGLNDLHLYTVGAGGDPAEPLEVSATLTLKAGDTGPIKVPLVRNGTGHWSAFGFPIPIAGTWELEVAALVTEIDLIRVRTEVPVR